MKVGWGSVVFKARRVYIMGNKTPGKELSKKVIHTIQSYKKVGMDAKWTLWSWYVLSLKLNLTVDDLILSDTLWVLPFILQQWQVHKTEYLCASDDSHCYCDV